MSQKRPPSLDPQAARRWAELPLVAKHAALAPHAPDATLSSPWLHEEVNRRMAERLSFIRLQPASWVCWNPVRGGLNALALLASAYPKAQGHLFAARPQEAASVKSWASPPRWRPQGWLTRKLKTEKSAPQSIDMVWANMLLHQAAEPEALLAAWHQVLAVDGFLMFSCLGPDTLQELRTVYAQKGWPMPAHEFTDMHDWGDMLVHAGFAEPVMDMEKITLTYVNSDKLLEDLRALGRNFHVSRFAGLRGRHWLKQWHEALFQLTTIDSEGALALTFEVVYGHALKPPARVKVSSESHIDLNDMRQMLQKPQKKHDQV
jgi:malonyl-CoA O-methyltransferase